MASGLLRAALVVAGVLAFTPAFAEEAARPVAPWTPRAVALADQASAVAARAPEDERIARAMHWLSEAAAREQIEMSVTVTPLDSGRAITSHHAGQATNPASNTKLATAAYAL